MSRRRRGGLQYPKPLAAVRCPRTIRRFLALIEVSAEGEWLWRGTRDSKGYGRFRLGSSCLCAHRVSFAIFRGPIPEGHVIHHLRGPTHNVNPDDLSLATVLENTAYSNARHRRPSHPDASDIPI